MADEFLNDHEQSEQVRKWLKANANALAFGVLLGLGSLVGWGWWKGNLETQKAQAASQYGALKSSVEAKNLDQLKAQVGTLVGEFGDSGFSALAQLKLAQLAFEKGDKALATSSLEWVVARGATEELKNVARVRLARLKNADGKFADAIALLDPIKEAAFVGISSEIRGDSLRGMNKFGDARAAYQKALDELEAGAGNRNFIEMKLYSVSDAKVAS